MLEVRYLQNEKDSITLHWISEDIHVDTWDTDKKERKSNTRTTAIHHRRTERRRLCLCSPGATWTVRPRLLPCCWSTQKWTCPWWSWSWSWPGELRLPWTALVTAGERECAMLMCPLGRKLWDHTGKITKTYIFFFYIISKLEKSRYPMYRDKIYTCLSLGPGRGTASHCSSVSFKAFVQRVCGKPKIWPMIYAGLSSFLHRNVTAVGSE